MNEATQVIEGKKGFNWLAFFFSSAYYAGKGRLGKGIFFAFLAATRIGAFFVMPYAGFKANKELDHSKEFNWGKAAIAGVLQAMFYGGIAGFIKGFIK